VSGDAAPNGARFATTRWSLVLAAGGGSTPDARAALESLLAACWYPLYAFARREGAPRDEAEDLVQGFLAELLEKDRIRQADPARGRFRTFLLAAFRHFRSRERERDRAAKRGGGRAALTLDFESGEGRYSREPADARTPETLFLRRWALDLLEEALRRTREEYERGGRGDLFEALRGTLGSGAPAGSWAAVGEGLRMGEGAVKVSAHRLRRRYREHLRGAIGETVADPADVDGEIRDLMAALAG
jgi:DNA-directed RNA polymerase specialized sigma24 family protein